MLPNQESNPGPLTYESGALPIALRGRQVMKGEYPPSCLSYLSERLHSPVVRELVGCFGLNGPLRQYFSLYRAISQREGERKEK